jgi:hypothetical protein
MFHFVLDTNYYIIYNVYYTLNSKAARLAFLAVGWGVKHGLNIFICTVSLAGVLCPIIKFAPSSSFQVVGRG